MQTQHGASTMKPTGRSRQLRDCETGPKAMRISTPGSLRGMLKWYHCTDTVAPLPTQQINVRTNLFARELETRQLAPRTDLHLNNVVGTSAGTSMMAVVHLTRVSTAMCVRTAQAVIHASSATGVLVEDRPMMKNRVEADKVVGPRNQVA